MYEKIVVGDRTISPIDWEMTPDLTFGTYESWGGRERVKSNSEKIYYFYVDNWGDTPKVCLMERGVKHAKIMAEIDVPLSIVKQCVEEQGSSSLFEKSYAIDENLKNWLKKNVLDVDSSGFVKPVVEHFVREEMGPVLARAEENPFIGEVVALPWELRIYQDDDVEAIINKWNFYDGDLNTQGAFENHFVSSEHEGIIIDLRTSLMWQTAGLDICSTRTMHLNIDKVNESQLAGYNDWRMPSIEEAMSLLNSTVNNKDIHLHPCFSKEQPFIFVAAKRKPGGYWFVDYKHGRSFWSSGTIPGGFGRLCRTVA